MTLATVVIVPMNVQTVFDAQTCENPSGHVVDEVFDPRGLKIETRIERRDDGAGTSHGGHVLDLDQSQWRFPVTENQLSTFLESARGSALDQILGHPTGDSSERVRRAGHDDHSIVHEGSTGGRGADITIVVKNHVFRTSACQLIEIKRLDAEFIVDDETATGL